MRAGPVTCFCLCDDQLILSGSSLGSITVSGSLSDRQLVTLRSRITIGGILFLLCQKSLFGHVYILFISLLDPLEFAYLH